MQNTRNLTTMGMLAALSVALVLFVHFPLFPQAPFLEYDPANVPILIGTFALGPVAGLGITLAASVVQGFTVSAQSGPYGVLMHIVATGTYVLVAGLIYRARRTRLGAGIALVCGALAMALMMCGANLVITPLFMGTQLKDVLPMLLPVILPFNLLKAGINGLATFLLYKPVSTFLKRRGVKTMA